MKIQEMKILKEIISRSLLFTVVIAILNEQVQIFQLKITALKKPKLLIELCNVVQPFLIH